MKIQTHFTRFELVALLVCALSIPFTPYMALPILAALVWHLATKLHKARSQHTVLQQEIATLVRNEQLLKDQAYTDSLTGLANRLLLTDRFQLTLERSKRNRGQFAVMMVDLDAFKAINDNFGHAAGDHVLRTVAKRLVSAVRASDTVARLGGDEFVLIIESFENPDELVRIGRKLIATISEDIHLPDGSVVHVGASAGFALFPHHGSDLNDMLHIADKGMYDCKISGLMELH